MRLVTHKSIKVPVWVVKLVDSQTTFSKFNRLSNFLKELFEFDIISQLKSPQRKIGKLQSSALSTDSLNKYHILEFESGGRY